MAPPGEGYTTDFTLPQLDRGNSLFDIRHRAIVNYVIQLPGQNIHGVLGAIVGGWSYNGVWAFQTGAHWEPFTSRSAKLTGDCSTAGISAGLCVNTGGDFNLDHGRNDRPDSTMANFNPSRDLWKTGWAFDGSVPGTPTLTSPCLGCSSNLGRNTFVGPGMWSADMTLGKVFKITEQVNLKFEAQGFNVFNRANFLLATSGTQSHNNLRDSNFGKAAGTLNARNLQFGLRVSF
jgi:hypothetical protein